MRGGGTPRRSTPEFYGGSIPWVTPKDMKQAVIDDSSVRLTQAGMDSSPAKLIAPGSVLVVVRSGVLKHTLPVALTTAPVTVNQDMKALTPSDEVHPAFLARLIKSLQPLVLSWVRATTADNFPIENLLDLDVQIPPLSEQRRIAAILDQADALRAKRRRILTLVDALPQSIFDDLFGSEIWNSTIGEIASVQTGPFGSLLHKEDYVSGGVSVINPMHIRNGQLQPDVEFSVTESKAASLSLYRLQEGDVVLGRRGEMGRAGVVGAQHVGMLCGTGSLILRPRDVDSRFLHSVVTSPRMKAHLERSSLGATLPNLNATIVRTSPAPRAPDQAQAQFAEALRAVDGSRSATRRAAIKNDELFASLQSRAFRGEL
ncbi:restriction endonuclease subunit S [Nocardioides faecalis]|uniref:restriction endonuclease subunit S n=1 Tax=Nocardioides faecalis TaxID=2803858 RepID=UPI0027DC7C13|nr:restriction endonuclease subunit S [Nocardioides faecalis]